MELGGGMGRYPQQLHRHQAKHGAYNQLDSMSRVTGRHQLHQHQAEWQAVSRVWRRGGFSVWWSHALVGGSALLGGVRSMHPRKLLHFKCAFWANLGHIVYPVLLWHLRNIQSTLNSLWTNRSCDQGVIVWSQANTPCAQYQTINLHLPSPFYFGEQGSLPSTCRNFICAVHTCFHSSCSIN